MTHERISGLRDICVCVQFSSVHFSHSVVSDSLRPHESQHARPPCPSPTPGVHSDSRPSSQWCHPAISSSVIPFSSCPQSLPASESFPTSQLFAWGGQSTGVSALASFLPKKSQGWSPSEWSSVYRAIRNSRTIPSSHLSSPATINVFSKSVSLFLFCKWVHLYHLFLDSTYKGCHMTFILLCLTCFTQYDNL